MSRSISKNTNNATIPTPKVSITTTNLQNRKKPTGDVTQLYTRSCGLCAFPGCKNECMIDATPLDRPKNVGKIAHIVAHSNGGPRSDPTLSQKDRDRYENWVLLCGYHHDVVDVQPNTYTCDDLRKWKKDREQWVKQRTREQIPNVGFKELDAVCRSIATQPPRIGSEWDKTLTPPLEKMRKNNLTESTNLLLMSGLALAHKVGFFIDGKVKMDYDFPIKLKEGFVKEYNILYQEGVRGDDLFEKMHEFASGGSHNMTYLAASLGVLSYLFEKCDIFEI